MKLRSCIKLFSFALLAACSQTEIVSDYDKQADFASYKTFSVCLMDMEVENADKPGYDNPINRARIKLAIVSEMKNYYALNDTASDLLAGFHIAIKENKLTYMNCHTENKYNTGPVCKLDTQKYTEGTLVVYVTDLKKGEVIWQASANGVLGDSPVSDEKLIQKTVKRLFEEFPLNAKK